MNKQKQDALQKAKELAYSGASSKLNTSLSLTFAIVALVERLDVILDTHKQQVKQEEK